MSAITGVAACGQPTAFREQHRELEWLHVVSTDLAATSTRVLSGRRSKAWVCGRSPAEIVGSNPARGNECLSVVCVVFGQVEVSATSSSLVHRSSTGCGVPLCMI